MTRWPEWPGPAESPARQVRLRHAARTPEGFLLPRAPPVRAHLRAEAGGRAGLRSLCGCGRTHSVVLLRHDLPRGEDEWPGGKIPIKQRQELVVKEDDTVY